jgi:hypothetical protein
MNDERRMSNVEYNVFYRFYSMNLPAAGCGVSSFKGKIHSIAASWWELNSKDFVSPFKD